jgi:hypothetical protein
MKNNVCWYGPIVCFVLDNLGLITVITLIGIGTYIWLK